MSAPTSIAMWSLGADVALMGSILLFVYRVLRNPTNPRGLRQLGELEGTIRSLIREAEGSGKSLNDQLIRRQEGLEKLLFDLEACEKRIHRLQSRAEETRGGVDVSMVKVQKALDALNAALARFQTRELQVRYVAERGVVPEEAPTSQIVQAPNPAQSVPVRQSSLRPTDPGRKGPSHPWYEAPEGAHQSSEETGDADYDGVYGGLPPRALNETIQRERLGQGRDASRQFREQSFPQSQDREQRPESFVSSSSIHDQITVDRTKQKPRVTREHLAEAQSLLRQGLSVEEVSRRSGLLVDQVRLLSALGDGRPTARPVTNRTILRPAIDPRLGVLGNVRRQPS